MKWLYGAMIAAAACAKTPVPEVAAADSGAPPGEVWLSKEQAKSGEFRVLAVQTATLAATVHTAGRVTFDDSRVTHVFSPVSGRIVQIYAALGETVKKGAKLARIESADLGQAFSDLLKARADLIAAGHDIKRQRLLVQAKAAPRAALEVSEDNHRRAMVEEERALLKLKLLHVNPSHSESVTQGYVLRAPIDGEILMRGASPGFEVQGMMSGANIATELFTIGSLDRVWLLLDVFEIDLNRVKIGNPVHLKTIAGDVIDAKVDWVSKVLDPQLRTGKVRCIVENERDVLRGEMYLSGTIGVGTRTGILLPRDAIMRIGEQMIAFVELPVTGEIGASSGSARYAMRRLKLGAQAGNRVEVLQGIAPGDRVVVSGGLLLTSYLSGSVEETKGAR